MAVSGSRRAGWQQFAAHSVLLDIRSMNRVMGLDGKRGLLQVESGSGGSFYLTYDRFARRADLDSAYPQFGEYLALHKRYDSIELLQSNWCRH
jgi:hypothetical protein